MPELESPCDSGSKILFPTQSFTPEHRFAFDSRVPASSCVQYSRTAKLLVIASLRCSSQTNMSGIVYWTANRPKIPFLASICCSDARNMFPWREYCTHELAGMRESKQHRCKHAYAVLAAQKRHAPDSIPLKPPQPTTLAQRPKLHSDQIQTKQTHKPVGK